MVEEGTSAPFESWPARIQFDVLLFAHVTNERSEAQ